MVNPHLQAPVAVAYVAGGTVTLPVPTDCEYLAVMDRIVNSASRLPHAVQVRNCTC